MVLTVEIEFLRLMRPIKNKNTIVKKAINPPLMASVGLIPPKSEERFVVDVSGFSAFCAP